MKNIVIIIAFLFFLISGVFLGNKFFIQKQISKVNNFNKQGLMIKKEKINIHKKSNKKTIKSKKIIKKYFNNKIVKRNTVLLKKKKISKAIQNKIINGYYLNKFKEKPITNILPYKFIIFDNKTKKQIKEYNKKLGNKEVFLLNFEYKNNFYNFMIVKLKNELYIEDENNNKILIKNNEINYKNFDIKVKEI